MPDTDVMKFWVPLTYQIDGMFQTVGESLPVGFKFYPTAVIVLGNINKRFLCGHVLPKLTKLCQLSSINKLLTVQKM